MRYPGCLSLTFARASHLGTLSTISVPNLVPQQWLDRCTNKERHRGLTLSDVKDDPTSIMTALLPSELWLEVADHLDPLSIAYFALTSRFFGEMFTKVLHLRRLNHHLHRHEKYKLLWSLERSSEYICFDCMKLHNWKSSVNLGRFSQSSWRICPSEDTRLPPNVFWPRHLTILLK